MAAAHLFRGARDGGQGVMRRRVTTGSRVDDLFFFRARKLQRCVKTWYVQRRGRLSCTTESELRRNYKGV